MSDAKVDEAKRYILEQYPQVWDTQEVQKEFKITSFLAPFCAAIRRADNVKGSLEFGDYPGRVYFNWMED